MSYKFCIMDIMTNNSVITQKNNTKKSLSFLTWLLIIGGMIATGGVWFFAKPVLPVADTTPPGFSVQGVAINQTSGYVDYHNLTSNGIDFTYLRATTGASFSDDDYQSNYDRASAAKLKVGSIQVYDSSTNADTQAQYFIDKVGDKIGQLPIAIYVTQDQVSAQDSKERLATLIQTLTAHYEKAVVIYTTPDVKKQLASTISQTKYWLISSHANDKKVTNQFIQYSEDHTIGTGLKAIKMPTSVFNGTEKEFEEIK